MSGFRGLRRVLRVSWGNHAIDREVENEVSFHLAERTDELRRRGLTDEEARKQALREFGDVAAAQQELSEIDRRMNARRLRSGWLSEVRSDASYALRQLRRGPGFAMAVIGTLSLGIGLNGTVFSIVDGMVLRPLPFAEPDRLVTVTATRGAEGGGASYEEFLAWRSQASSVERIAALRESTVILTDGGEPMRAAAGFVSAGLFELLGVRPELGRTFSAHDDRAGAPDIAMLSHALWLSRYGGDARVLGRMVTVNGRLAEVVGVMPVGYGYPGNEDLWMPLEPRLGEGDRDARGLWVAARLSSNADLAAAQAELTGLAERFDAARPGIERGWAVQVRPMREGMVGRLAQLVTFAMLGAVTLVLLTACANVASLLLARAVARGREIAIRISLGASKARLIRQLLTESLVIALLSAPLGALLAVAGVRWFVAALPAGQIPVYMPLRVDGRVVLYIILVSALTAIVFGLSPALRASRTDLRDAAGAGSDRPSRGRRARETLVAAQVALALVLLVAASLFVRTFLNLQSADVGFDTRSQLVVRVFMADSRYDSTDARARLVQDVLQRIEALPGVEAAAAANAVPLIGNGGNAGVEIEGRTFERGREPVVAFTGVTSRYFHTLGLPFLAGRTLSDADERSGTRVAVVSASFARVLFDATDPATALGARFRLPSVGGGEPYTVIGVAADVGIDDPRNPVRATVVWLPYAHASAQTTALFVRAMGDPLTIAAGVREAVRDADDALPVIEVRTMDSVRRSVGWQYTVFSGAFGLFGAIAIVLAAVGLWGVVANAVSQRTHEIGVRLALGATSRQLVRAVMLRGLRSAAIGVFLGLLGALAVSRLFAFALWEVGTFDPISLAMVAIPLLVVALLASWLPARRVTRADPMIALRSS